MVNKQSTDMIGIHRLHSPFNPTFHLQNSTGRLRSRCPTQRGGFLALWKFESLVTIKSSIALAYLTRRASLKAVPSTAKLNGMLLKECTDAGTVMMGYPACAAT